MRFVRDSCTSSSLFLLRTLLFARMQIFHEECTISSMYVISSYTSRTTRRQLVTCFVNVSSRCSSKRIRSGSDLREESAKETVFHGTKTMIIDHRACGANRYRLIRSERFSLGHVLLSYHACVIRVTRNTPAHTCESLGLEFFMYIICT